LGIRKQTEVFLAHVLGELCVISVMIIAFLPVFIML